MKITPEYGNAAFIVPSRAVEFLGSASEKELACLMYVLSAGEFSPSDGAAKLGIDEKKFLSLIKAWEKRGVVTVSDTAHTASHRVVPTADTTPKSVHKRRSSLPAYTTEETARFLEENERTAEIIDSCENIIGKIFTTAETNIVIGLMDHLSLSGDYILLLFAHAAKIDKKSVRYIEKLALSFADRDITSYGELELELANIELTESTVKFIRKLFGIGRRVLTEKERAMVENWCVKWSFDNEIIEKAYEITANATGDASLNYANAILENWYKAGLKTIGDIEGYSAEFERKKTNSKPTKNYKTGSATPFESSFDTDDFFEAALKRSYDPEKK